MFASSLFVLLASIVAVFAQTETSTTYLTATMTITQCNPTNTACPLYTPPPSTSSSSIITSSSSIITSSSSILNTTTSSSAVPTFYPTLNSTSHAGPTAYPNTTLSSFSSVYPTPTVYPTTSEYPTTTPAPTATPVPTGAASLLTMQSGLLMGALGMAAALLA